ncbi:MAG: cytochrome c5 family protein [Burkholderiales bacterium]|nr:cytochrome c5 family protein [Burkholderiales bacterium]
MSQQAPSESHESLIKTPNQLVAAVVLAFVVPIAIIVMITQYVTGGMKTDPSDPVFSEEATARRIKPVGEVVLGEAPPPPPTAAPVAQVAAGPADGKSVFDKSCSACHSTGAAGAPKAGDAGAWGSRIAQGKNTLYEHALKGIRAMPAKGGNPALSDDEVKAAVDHIIAVSK